MVRKLNKNVSDNCWPTAKNLKVHSQKKSSITVPKIPNLDQKIKDSKYLICSLSFIFRFSGSVSKPTKISNKVHSFTEKTSVILETSTHLNIIKNILSQISQKVNLILIHVRYDICATPFLDAQEKHSQSTWKANVYILMSISVRRFFFQKRRKLLFSGWGLNDFLKVSRCFY